jgi:uracil-DNA glycosylase
LDGEGDKVSEPDPEDIKACRPRLIEFCRIAKPRYIVHVGTLARKFGIVGQNDIGAEWMPQDSFIKFTDIKHPAFILRANIAQKGLLIQTAVVNIRSMLDEPF